MSILDGIFQGDDVILRIVINIIYHSCQGGGFTTAGRTGNQYHANVGQQGQGMNNLTGGAPASLAPVAPAAPRVKGIITSGGQSVAIIEYNGRSGTYTSGQAIGGGYTVDGISGKTVSINGNSVDLGGRR